MGVTTHDGRRAREGRCSGVFDDIWVAYDEDHEPSRWALQVGAALVRAGGGRLVVTHVAPPAEEAVDEREGLLVELLGLREDVRRRKRLAAVVALAAPDGWSDVSVVCGPVVPELLAQLHQARPDVLVVGEGRGRVGRALRAQSPCPVLVVREPHDRERPVVMLAPDARGRLAARTRLPLLVVPRRARIVGDHRPNAMTSSHLVTAPADRPRAVRGRDSSLLWRLFGASAAIVVVATLALLLAPVSVSRSVVFAEAVVVLTGVAVLLTAILVVLRRGLAPLRSLTDVMGTIDPHHPGRRLPEPLAGPSEVIRLTEAFNDMLDRLEDERRDSARRALAAQEDERLRIAREMHDGVGQTLTAIALQAERAAQAGEADPELLARLASSAQESLTEVRRLARELRPEALDDLGLGNALITLCRRMQGEGATRVEAHLEPGLPKLTPEAELVIYRVAQEAITNALRHAGASRVDLTLRPAGDVVELTVSDDGVGIQQQQPSRAANGIAGMRERALLAGGRLTLTSAPGAGTTVALALPAGRPAHA
jgi:two-component system sensor histidine kinase UhpB